MRLPEQRGVSPRDLRILNRGESVHTLQRIIHYGSIAAARGRRHEELLAISGSLTLLTNMVMAWTTSVCNRSWTGGSGPTRRVEPDLLRHIGPMHFQNINFRGEMAFPLARYRSRLIPGCPQRRDTRHTGLMDHKGSKSLIHLAQ